MTDSDKCPPCAVCGSKEERHMICLGLNWICPKAHEKAIERGEKIKDMEVGHRNTVKYNNAIIEARDKEIKQLKEVTKVQEEEIERVKKLGLQAVIAKQSKAREVKRLKVERNLYRRSIQGLFHLSDLTLEYLREHDNQLYQIVISIKPDEEIPDPEPVEDFSKGHSCEETARALGFNSSTTWVPLPKDQCLKCKEE